MTTPPPPIPIDPSPRRLKIAGALLACSTPISGLLCFAVASVLFGEDRFEGPDGLTVAGVFVIAIPLVVGAAMFSAGFLGVSGPRNREVGYGLAAVGAAGAVIGVYALVTGPDGDASIGGGLLILAAVPMLFAAGWLLYRTRR